VGRRHAGRGIYPYIALIGSTYWFAYFLVILPLLGVIEKPLPQPATIEEDFKAHYGKSERRRAHRALRRPRPSDRKDDMSMFRNLPSPRHGAVALPSGAALAAGRRRPRRGLRFSFEGPFGRFDQNQLQRGLQVYTEVCSACHGLQYVPLRTLSDEGGPGLPEDQVRAYIDMNFIEVYDPTIQDSAPATPNDHFPNRRWKTRPTSA
jgi:cytochrome c1